MTTTRAGVVLRHIRGLAARPAGTADRDLLERFTAGRDEAAFAELVRRHGPLVRGVCRRLLRDPNDAAAGTLEPAWAFRSLIFLENCVARPCPPWYKGGLGAP
jgi:hypothetical protein